MKKQAFIVLILFALFIGISPSSAFWPFDLFKKNLITGNVVEDNVAVESSATCNDSDGGIYSEKEGIVIVKRWWGKVPYKDYCGQEGTRDAPFLYESYCDKGKAKTEVFECERGCKDGACGAAVVEDVSCNQKEFSMAFIILAQDQSQVTSQKKQLLDNIKDKFSEDFEYATGGLAKMDTSYPIQVIIGDSSMISSDSSWIYTKNVLNKFYLNNSDKFDFVSIYPVFDDFNTGKQESHEKVQNYIQGIGTSVEDHSAEYGSSGKLLGINSFGNLNYKERAVDGSMVLLHETGHQWCCYVGDDFSRGANNAKLEIIQQGIHFYRGLASPVETGDPMESDYWVFNEATGFYERDNREGIPKYHPIDLYFMGLIDPSEYGVQYQIYDSGVIGVDFNDKQAKPYKKVSIQDIISVEGPRKCLKKEIQEVKICNPSEFKYLPPTKYGGGEIIFKTFGKKDESCTVYVSIDGNTENKLNGIQMTCEIPLEVISLNPIAPQSIESYASSEMCTGSLADLFKDLER